jgi:G:T-mismatch repair DNA endonuclease (very short patch repair protein)
VGQTHIADRKATSKNGYEPRRYNAHDKVAGTESLLKKRQGRAHWWHKTPTGYLNATNAFKGQCLLVAAVLGNLWNKLNEQSDSALSKDLKVVKSYFSKNRTMSLKMANIVKLGLSDLYTLLNVSGEDPIQLKDCDKIAAFYQSQFIVYNDEMPPSVQLYPPVRNLKLAPIFLYLTKATKTPNGHFHADLITKITAFYNTRGFSCTGCKFSTKYYSNYKHYCHATRTKTCFVCRRMLLKVDTYRNEAIKKIFCNRNLVTNFAPTKCHGCGLTMYSEECKIAHNKGSFCKRLGFSCVKCKKFMLRSRCHKTMSQHRCRFNPTCHICLEERIPGKLHLCPWRVPTPSKFLNNLGFLHFNYKTVLQECKECNDSFDFTCKMHPFGPEREIMPMLGNFMYEHTFHGSFSRQFLYDPQFEKREELAETDFLNFDYLPKGLDLQEKLHTARPTTRFGRTIQVNKTLAEKIRALKVRKEPLSVAEQLLCLVLDAKYQNYTIVTTDRLAINFIIQAMIKNEIRPQNPTVMGSSTVSLTFPSFNLRFVCLTQYLQGGIEAYKKQFNLSPNLKYFPTKMQLSGNQSNLQLLQAPEFHFYQDIMDSKAQRLEKYRFWTEIRAQPFDYLTELEGFSNSQLLICSLAGLHFAKTSFNFQATCLNHFERPPQYKEDSLNVVSAFHYQSMPSFMKHSFRTFALKPGLLFVVKDQYKDYKGKPTQAGTSNLEVEVTEFLRHKNPGKWMTKYSSTAGQKKFYLDGETSPHLIADAYNTDLKICFLFNGCYWHGHQNPDCPIVSQLSKNEKKTSAFRAKYNRLSNQIELLLRAFSQDVAVVEMLWECEFLELKKTQEKRNQDILQRPLPLVFAELHRMGNNELITFLGGPLLRPLTSLRVRDAFSASLCEAYALKYVKRANDRKQCHILDISSLFPFIGIQYRMPCGEYYTVLGDDLRQHEVTFDSAGDVMLHKNRPFLGIVQCRVYPPKTLLHPFLHTKVNNIVVGTLCKKCSELCVQLEEGMFCSHTDWERSFVGTYTSQELAYASTLNYKFEFFELMVYPKSDFFLQKFLTLLGFNKLRHCDFPESVGDDPEKQAAYCKEINELMNFKQILDVELTPCLISPNQEMRTFFKSCLNSFLGTFGTNVEKHTTVKFLSHYTELTPYLESDRLVDMHPVSENILRVSLSNIETIPSRVNNVTVSCFITSLARVLVHKRMQELVALNALILRVSCDCIYFVMDEGLLPQLPTFKISEAFGCFKHEFEQVEGVAQVGLRNVSVLYRDKDGFLKEHLITSGTTLSEENRKILSHQSFENMLDKMVTQKCVDFSGMRVTQVRNVHDAKKQKVSIVRRQQTVFSRNLFARRQILSKTPCYETLPYGWVPESPSPVFRLGSLLPS